MSEDDPDRRKFLKLATCGLGGIVGVAAAAPSVSLLLAPASRKTVTTPSDPIDLGDAEIAKAWTNWRKVDVVAPEVRDGWTTARNIVLGAAFVRSSGSKFEALSGVCPHLGCAVAWER